MEIDYNAIINMAILAEVKKQDPAQAKLLNVFVKKGIPVMEAIAMLMEIGTIAQEIQERDDEPNKTE